MTTPESAITKQTSRSLASALGAFGMHPQIVPRLNVVNSLFLPRSEKPFGGATDGIRLNGHLTWTPWGTDNNPLLRATIGLERSDDPGVAHDYEILHEDPVKDTWKVEKFIRPIPTGSRHFRAETTPASGNKGVDTFELFDGLDIELDKINASRQMARELELTTPTEAEAAQLLRVVQENLAVLS